MVVYERIVEQRFPPTRAAGPLLRVPNRANARFPPNLTVRSHPCTALDEAGLECNATNHLMYHITRKIETLYSVACCRNTSENMLQHCSYKLDHNRDAILIGNSSWLAECCQTWGESYSVPCQVDATLHERLKHFTLLHAAVTRAKIFEQYLLPAHALLWMSDTLQYQGQVVKTLQKNASRDRY